MSNPEKIVVSLEMAKKLKDAGWEKETVFHWVCDDPRSGRFSCVGDKYIYEPNYRVYTTRECNQAFTAEPHYSYVLAAPTWKEIWDELPWYIEGDYFKTTILGHVEFQSMVDDKSIIPEYTSLDEMKSIAECWIWCKGNGDLDK